MSSVQQKKSKGIQRNKHSLFKETKLIDRNIPQERSDIRLTKQKQKSFQYVQRDKGMHGHITKEIRKINKMRTSKKKLKLF